MSEQFKGGEDVQWTSMSSGFKKKKQGFVIVVVPPGADATDTLYEHIPNCDEKYHVPIFGMARNHESYIVLVGEKQLYWPRVCHLRKVEE